MKKIQDRFVAGAISGLGANIVKNMIQRGALMLGIARNLTKAGRGVLSAATKSGSAHGRRYWHAHR